ncbi:MAG TPA: peptide deformylase [bacterium]|nr:peptide deformylase [bacterium]
MKRLLIIALSIFIVSCATTQEKTQINEGALTESEIEFINSSEKMRVFKNTAENDDAVLRNISKKTLMNSKGYDVLEKKMMESLLEEKGVGIAAPQVGVNRRVIIVQRLDKEEKPLEYYYNPVITEKRGELIEGWEGCLSVPDGFGKVMRSQDIDIEYDKNEGGNIVRFKEKIAGWTAVIFQHEIDHLDGILFIDKKCEGDLVPKEEYYEMRKKQKEEVEATKAEKTE